MYVHVCVPQPQQANCFVFTGKTLLFFIVREAQGPVHHQEPTQLISSGGSAETPGGKENRTENKALCSVK